MTDMQGRGKAFEEHYHYKVDRNISIKAKSYKCMGLWVAEVLGILDADKAIDYAMELVIYEYDPKHEGNAIDKIMADFKKKGATYDRYDVEDKLEEFRQKARKEIVGEE